MGAEGGGGGAGRSRPLGGPTLSPPVRRRSEVGRSGVRRDMGRALPSSLLPARPAKPRGPARSSRPTAAPFLIPLNLPHLTFSLLILFFLGAAAEGRSYEYSYGDGAAQKNGRITCYTCVNVSNNDECNRFAIDRPCPEGGDYCLTLHVMDGLDRERSVLVNKRCASLEDCTGDSTGCTTAYGQTQCVSCCDQPYCNDSVPSNSTAAVFLRSAGSAVVAGKGRWNGGLAWWAATALIIASKVSTFGGPS